MELGGRGGRERAVIGETCRPPAVILHRQVILRSLGTVPECICSTCIVTAKPGALLLSALSRRHSASDPLPGPQPPLPPGPAAGHPPESSP